MRVRMRKFLAIYSRYPSVAWAADRAGVAESIVYRWKRISPWFAERCKRAERSALDYVYGALHHKAVAKLDTTALLAILRAYRPDFQPKPKEHNHKHTGQPPANVNVSNTHIAFGHFTDEEMELFDRLLAKAGVPEHMLKPAPPEDV